MRVRDAISGPSSTEAVEWCVLSTAISENIIKSNLNAMLDRAGIQQTSG